MRIPRNMHRSANPYRRNRSPVFVTQNPIGKRESARVAGRANHVEMYVSQIACTGDPRCTGDIGDDSDRPRFSWGHEPPVGGYRSGIDQAIGHIRKLQNICIIGDVELSSIEVLQPQDIDPGDEVAAWGYLSGSVQGDRSCTTTVASDNGWVEQQAYQHT